MEGISFIVHAVKNAFPGARFYGTDGRFHDSAVPQLAAANWLASADFLREGYPDAVLLDIGSTTADIIPLGRFESLRGLSDLLRLQKGYLVYTGLLRGNVATLLRSVLLGGVDTPVSSEYFASAADAHLVLGHIGPSRYTGDTPDKKEKTRPASLRRLARVVCADLAEIGEEGAQQIAGQFWEIQRELVCTRVHRVAAESGSGKIIVGGIGSSLFSRELGGIDLRQGSGTICRHPAGHSVYEKLRNGVPGFDPGAHARDSNSTRPLTG